MRSSSRLTTDEKPNSIGTGKSGGAENVDVLLKETLRGTSGTQSDNDVSANDVSYMNLKAFVAKLKSERVYVSPAIAAVMFGRVMIHYSRASSIGISAWTTKKLTITALATALAVSAGAGELGCEDLDFADNDDQDFYASEIATHSTEILAIANLLSGAPETGDEDLQQKAAALILATFHFWKAVRRQWQQPSGLMVFQPSQN